MRERNAKLKLLWIWERREEHRQTGGREIIQERKEIGKREGMM